MRSRSLTILLSVCAALAVAPFVPWAVAATFNSVGDPWQGALGALVVTVPLGLGAAAVALAWHGLLLHRDLVESLEDNFGEVVAGSPQPATEALVLTGAVTSSPETSSPVTSSAPAGPAPAAVAVETKAPASAGGGKAAAAGGKAKQKAANAGKAAGLRTVRRAKSKTKNAASREVRGMLRGLRPGR